jgi:hypothetical protein
MDFWILASAEMIVTKWVVVTSAPMRLLLLGAIVDSD